MSHEISTTVADEINRHHVLATVRADEAIHHAAEDRKSTRLNSSHSQISYAVFCLKKKHCKASIYMMARPFQLLRFSTPIEPSPTTHSLDCPRFLPRVGFRTGTFSYDVASSTNITG